jgi:hypothetical protein
VPVIESIEDSAGRSPSTNVGYRRPALNTPVAKVENKPAGGIIEARDPAAGEVEEDKAGKGIFRPGISGRNLVPGS